ncbi:MAG: prepilin-type N-terminal cleavage/methylation domain-containing protein [bacterium]|nr:prepilin-type N-terminal cleavage/methylation domain-containing protein [bacterium]
MTKQLNKKGTSLVELIAVIVIMGIIAGIAIPTTIAVINRQKKNAAVKSAETVFNAAKSVLLEASTGQTIGYVTKDTTDTTVTKYSTTSALLASNSEIEKDPGDTGSVMTIYYNVPTSGQASYTVQLTSGYKINGVAITWTACDGFKTC